MQDKGELGELVMTLVDATLEQPPESRLSYINSACGGDPRLRLEVVKRVQWEERIQGFLLDTVTTTLGTLDRSFESGEYLAGRFRVIREIGQGGMGVVYEAFDEKLNRRVALKCAQAGHGHRLPPEARAAREVSHFNVCKVHDLHSAQTKFGEVEFLTMEFIEGETLSDRLRRKGPLDQIEAREIALQICAGLAQAHRQGVIHGDLKCGNVLLAQSPEGGMRAVVTDFGLASLQLPESVDNIASQQAGSFDYMAPELFSRSPASVASDLYALGVVFHVMLTGEIPGRQKTLPRLSQDASTGAVDTAPGDLNAPRKCQELPAPWNVIVTRCLEPRPENRFGSVDELIDQLGAPSRASTWTRRAAAIAAILTTLFWIGRPAAIRLAVLPFEVAGGTLTTAGGLALDVTDRLQGLRRGLVIVPPEEAQRSKVDSFDKARTVLSATHVLRTRLNNSGNQIEVLASVVDTGSGRALQELKGTYSANDTPLVAKALTATVTGAFHLRVGVPMELVSAAAYPSYIQGINLLRRDTVSADEAIPFFEKAIELDPRSALTYAGLAEAQIQKFGRRQGSQWLDLAAHSVAKAQSLNADSALVLLAAGLLEQQRGWYEQAAHDFSRAVELAPNSAEGWNRLANAYGSMNRSDEAIATYQKAIQAQPNYYAPYIDFGLFYYYRGQFKEAEQLFRRATVIAPGLAKGHMDLGVTLKEQNRLQEAERSLLTALHLQETSQVLTNLGALYYQQERFGEAAFYFEKSVNAEPPKALLYENLGEAYRHLGQPSAAAESFRRGLLVAESEVAQNPREPSSRGRLACLFALLGERDRAEFEITQALSMGAGNVRVLRDAVLTFEALEERDKTLQVLGNAPASLLEELSIQPDVRDLQRDRRFRELLRNKAAEK
ncbi:MAG TPA: serine/threonine-protein kinase [Bryobacteraceae bacterium]|nr:serine/threonine-protein kinase [Bryobacteraceae bacterium]